MSDDFESGEQVWEPRPIVFPTFRLPTRLAEPLSWGLLTAATASVVAAVVSAVSYGFPSPAQSAVLSGPDIIGSSVFPSVGFADRLAVFVRGGANLTVAMLLILAVVVAAMAVSPAVLEGSVRRGSVLLVALTLVASIVVLGNVVLAVEILTRTPLGITPIDTSDHLTAILNLLPAALAGLAAMAYAVVRLRPADRDIEEPTL